jgi:hypothetical protein
VLGIDSSPLALKVAKVRGVKKTRLLSFNDVDFERGSCDNVVMYGNNFGLFASWGCAKRLLKRLHRMTSPGAKIVCSSVDPHRTDDPDHLRYHRWNKTRGRMPGQVRIRVRYRAYVGEWFDYLLVSPEEMRELVVGTGRRVGRCMFSREVRCM